MLEGPCIQHNKFELYVFAETYDGPENVVTIINSTVTMECRNTGNWEEDIWLLKTVRMNKVVYMEQLSSSQASRWSENRTERYSQLIITGIEPEDAGLFVCTTEAGQYEAQLVILGNRNFNFE